MVPSNQDRNDIITHTNAQVMIWKLFWKYVNFQESIYYYSFDFGKKYQGPMMTLLTPNWVYAWYGFTELRIMILQIDSFFATCPFAAKQLNFSSILYTNKQGTYFLGLRFFPVYGLWPMPQTKVFQLVKWVIAKNDGPEGTTHDEAMPNASAPTPMPTRIPTKSHLLLIINTYTMVTPKTTSTLIMLTMSFSLTWNTKPQSPTPQPSYQTAAMAMDPLLTTFTL